MTLQLKPSQDSPSLQNEMAKQEVIEDSSATTDEIVGKPRERILKAALELFVKQGYFNTNVPDISKRSNCSVGSIYHHFINKEEIANQLYKEGISLFREALSATLNKSDSLEKNLKRIIVAFLTFAEDHNEYSRYLWLSRHSEFLQDEIASPTSVGFDKLGRQLTRIIKGAIRNCEIAPTSAELIWNIVFGLPISFTRDWLDGYTRNTPKQIAPELSERCWQALKCSA